MLLCVSLDVGERVVCPAALIVSERDKILKLPLVKSTVPQTYGPPSLIAGNGKRKSKFIPTSRLTSFVNLSVNGLFLCVVDDTC